MLRLLTKKKKQKKKAEINIQKNESLCLEELIASSGGKYNPIRTFYSHQILKATNHFDWKYTIAEDRFLWYKGMIENRQVLIKKLRDGSFFGVDNVYRDISISSMMSSHENVLKLLGCCREFPHPVLVFEYPENGALNDKRGGLRPFPWNIRLKIAKEIANSVAYLHSEFPRTIIHRDLKLEYIFLDENWSAKLFSFSLSILIPEGELGVNDIVCGTTGYAEPEYSSTGFVTENVDVYNLGIMMLVLLNGKPYLSGYRPALPIYARNFPEQGLLSELIDPSMLVSASHDIPQHSRLQMEAFVELALRCVRFRPGENAPRMIEVAKELKKIEKDI